MHVLFVHQNCPAQFKDIAPALVKRGWRCTFVTTNDKAPPGEGVRKIVYRPAGVVRRSNEITQAFLNETAHAAGVYLAMKRAKDVKPDVVVAHSGFGSSLFLPQLYDAPIVNFFEYFFRPGGASQHLAYRPDEPVSETAILRSRVRNGCFLLDLDNCTRGWCPNTSQRDTLPLEYHPKIEIIPEGIDTDFWKAGRRDIDAERLLPDGTLVPADTRIVTYVARGLERMRGFDVFMKMAKLVYSRFPDVLFVVVGEDRSYYRDDRTVTGGKTYREHVLAQDRYDASKFRFTGRVPPEQLTAILGMSDLHVYLTEPFVTSWSLLDAMSCGCTVLASDQNCVREYIKDGENGMLVDFFDAEGLAERAVAALANPAAHRRLGEAARRTIEEQGYALRDTLPRIEAMLQEVAAKPRTPSMRAELFVRHTNQCAAGRARLLLNRVQPPGASQLEPLVAARPPGVSGVEPEARPPIAQAAGDAHPVTAVAANQSTAAAAKAAAWNSALSGAAPPRGLLPIAAATARTRAPLAAAAAAAVAGVVASAAMSDRTPRGEPLSFHLPGSSPSKRILFCWELGAGLGHIMEIAPLVNAMCERGHRVFGAMRHLTECSKAFDPRARLLSAPYLAESRAPARPATRNFADILATQSFCDDDALLAHADAWREVFELWRPDVLVFDYSPTAMLAARFARPDATRIVIGNGFLIPPDTHPFPALRRANSGEADFVERMKRDEDVLLDRANRLLGNCDCPQLDHLGQLYGEVDLTLMMTLKEMDPYAAYRPASTEYLGAVNATGGKAPAWQEGEGPKVYAYLRPVPAMAEVLTFLGGRRMPAVVFAPALNEAGRRRFAGYKTLRFETERLDLARCGAECDLAVLNGNLGTSSAMLLAGKPALHLPEHLEHALNARAVASLGAGLVAPAKGCPAGEAVANLAALLDGDQHRAAAAAVAAKHRGFTPGGQVERMTEAMDGTLARAAA